jgi:integrase
LEFLILTAARTSEVLGATWEEVDFEHAVWSIPGNRMKAGRDHRVPLCTKAIAVLKHMQSFGVAPFIFFGRNRERPLSNMAMTVMIRRTKYQKTITVHGFRSAFRDWAAEMTDHDSRVAESALAHTDPNKVRSAYLRGDLWGKRVAMMNQWEAYCFKPCSICG